MVFGTPGVRIQLALAAALIGVAVYIFFVHREIRSMDQRLLGLHAAVDALRMELEVGYDDEEDVNANAQDQQPQPQEQHQQTHSQTQDQPQFEFQSAPPPLDEVDAASSVDSDEIRALMNKIEGHDQGEDDDDEDVDDGVFVDEDGDDDGVIEEAHVDVNNVVDDSNNDVHDDTTEKNVEQPPAISSPVSTNSSTTIYAEYKLRAMKIDELKNILRVNFDADPPAKTTKDGLVKAILDLQQPR
jgi:hypothetical protein